MPTAHICCNSHAIRYFMPSQEPKTDFFPFFTQNALLGSVEKLRKSSIARCSADRWKGHATRCSADDTVSGRMTELSTVITVHKCYSVLSGQTDTYLWHATNDSWWESELKPKPTRKLCYRKDNRASRSLRRYGHSKLSKMASWICSNRKQCH